MKQLRNTIFYRDRFTLFVLFILSCGYYSFYFSKIILFPNEVLSTIHGDGFHCYYTYMNHIVNNNFFIETNGLNYPYGEHFTFTDCIPIISIFLKLLPFTHTYLIGILHVLIFFSFALNPCIYYKLFKLFNVSSSIAFVASIAIPLLTPQTDRLGGHLSLSFACLIPLQLYFSCAATVKKQNKYFYYSTLLSILSFFIHPYLGFGLTLFSFLILFTHDALEGLSTLKRNGLKILLNVALPLIIFKLFLFITDHHTNRPDTPYGIDDNVAKVTSVFVPTFGPFQHFMKQIFKTNDRSWEGYSYVGFFVNFLIAGFILLLIFQFKKISIHKSLLAVLIAAVALLLFSFGIQNKVLESMHIEINFLKQFRALGRFAWFFYYSIPFFVMTVFFNYQKKYSFKYGKSVVLSLAFLLLGFNLIEANLFIRHCVDSHFNEKNIFLTRNLSEAEKKIISTVSKLNTQAILPIPYYNIGSEVFSRGGVEKSGYMSMLLSFYCKLPILANINARTSIDEAANSIGLLNQYKNHDSILKLLNNRRIALLQCDSLLRPDEERLISRGKFEVEVEHYRLFTLSRNSFEDKTTNNSDFIFIPNADKLKFDSLNTFYTKNVVLCTYNNDSSLKKIIQLDSNTFQSGDYVISFYYHFKSFEKNYIDCNFIEQSEANSKAKSWDHASNITHYAYYDSMFVFENKFFLDNKNNYTFLLHNKFDDTYRVSNLLIRPANKNTVYQDEKYIRINNYPIHN